MTIISLRRRRLFSLSLPSVAEFSRLVLTCLSLSLTASLSVFVEYQ